MTKLREMILETSLDDLVAAAERGEIEPDEVWAELLQSLERSVCLVSDMAQTQRETNAFLKSRLPELKARQDRIDRMIAEWRALEIPVEQDFSFEQGRDHAAAKA